MTDEPIYLPFSMRNIDLEAIPLTHGEVPSAVRNQFLILCHRFFGDPEHRYESPGLPVPMEVWQRICSEVAYFAGEYNLDNNRFFDYRRHLQLAQPNMALQAMELALKQMGNIAETWQEGELPCMYRFGAESTFQEVVSGLNNSFFRARLGYRYLEDQIIEVESDYLYAEVTVPAVRLLAAAEFETALSEFMMAHKDMRDDDFAGAVVKANNAFESTLRRLCDLKGWSHAPKASGADLLKVVFRNGDLADYQKAHLGSLHSTLEKGLPEVRHSHGGHGLSLRKQAVSRAIASYAVNLAATNIVFLLEAFGPFAGTE